MEYKDFHEGFTKSAEDPTSFTLVGNEADRIVKWMSVGSAEHLIRLEEEGRGDREAQGFGGLQINGKLELDGLLHR
jgi:hypothetical protein